MAAAANQAAHANALAAEKLKIDNKEKAEKALRDAQHQLPEVLKESAEHLALRKRRGQEYTKARVTQKVSLPDKREQKARQDYTELQRHNRPPVISHAVRAFAAVNIGRSMLVDKIAAFGNFLGRGASKLIAKARGRNYGTTLDNKKQLFVAVDDTTHKANFAAMATIELSRIENEIATENSKAKLPADLKEGETAKDYHDPERILELRAQQKKEKFKLNLYTLPFEGLKAKRDALFAKEIKSEEGNAERIQELEYLLAHEKNPRIAVAQEIKRQETLLGDKGNTEEDKKKINDKIAKLKDEGNKLSAMSSLPMVISTTQAADDDSPAPAWIEKSGLYKLPQSDNRFADYILDYRKSKDQHGNEDGTHATFKIIHSATFFSYNYDKVAEMTVAGLKSAGSSGIEIEYENSDFNRYHLKAIGKFVEHSIKEGLDITLGDNARAGLASLGRKGQDILLLVKMQHEKIENQILAENAEKAKVTPDAPDAPGAPGAGLSEQPAPSAPLASPPPAAGSNTTSPTMADTSQATSAVPPLASIGSSQQVEGAVARPDSPSQLQPGAAEADRCESPEEVVEMIREFTKHYNENPSHVASEKDLIKMLNFVQDADYVAEINKLDVAEVKNIKEVLYEAVSNSSSSEASKANWLKCLDDAQSDPHKVLTGRGPQHAPG